MDNQLSIPHPVVNEGSTPSFPSERPRREVTNIQVMIEARSERIEVLKRALQGVQTLHDETALLRELSDEIVALRELREMAIFCKASLP